MDYRINSIGSLRLFNISFANSGVYECTAKNIHGQESARGTVAVLGNNLLCIAHFCYYTAIYLYRYLIISIQ